MSITEDITEFRSKKVTIMGLGLHGGGISSARFFARAGAHVTVTDLRDQNTLAPAIEQLQGLDIRFV
ncbi:MAG: UDP-N-acetylmuramoyl-L-alanine--D-glutamate ligase, partial [Spirochaetia bacterium]|nr:UDP-N-acetylmuramoyl-L-alanine--D-glutamate ligase [Spirochaetia bacterium]